MVRSAGTMPGERQLLGPQTSGRTYTNLSQPNYGIKSLHDVKIPMRDGVQLLADVHLPQNAGRCPVLLAISPYPREAQYLGIPAGMIEAGQTDFWVPRGYVHLIVNIRGTGGSEGVYGFGSAQEHHDLYDVIEWAAAQSWSDGNVGMLGVSYFAIVQCSAALEKPPHLKAIFPWSVTADFYREVVWHGGMFSGRFLGLYFNMLGMMSKRSTWFRSFVFKLINRFLQIPSIHRKFERSPKDTLSAFGKVMVLDYDRSPWEDLYKQIAIEHPLFDEYWQARDLTPHFHKIDIPIYTGADWENVGLHLGAPFLAMESFSPDVPWRVMMGPRGSLQWPWESFHVEALAWYDHWLKGKDTGIMEGAPIRYYVEGADEWRSAEMFPLPETQWRDLYLDGSGTLTPQAPADNEHRHYEYHPSTMLRGKNTPKDGITDALIWDTEPFKQPVELIGPFVLHLDACSTAPDTDWIVKLCDAAPDGTVSDLTQGWLRASHRAVDPQHSKPYRPYHPFDQPQALISGEVTRFEIEILPTAQRFAPGHCLRLILTSSDTQEGFAMQGIAHAPLGIGARNTVVNRSRLTVPLVSGSL